MHSAALRLAGALWLAAWAGPLAAQPGTAAAGEAAAAAQGVVEASRGSIPPSDADLAAIRRHAEQILALANDCRAKPCPVVETCAVAARVLQSLSDAQAYLEALETALNHGAEAASAAHNNVVIQTRITSTNLAIAQQALAMQEYLYKLAVMLFDLASLADDLKTMAEKGSLTPGDNWAQKLDSAYETLKDAEGLANDISGAVDGMVPPPPGTAEGLTPLSDATGQLLGVKQDTMSTLNDLKSSLSDAANAFDELRSELKKNNGVPSKDMLGGLSKAAAKIAFRALKVEVERRIAALKKLIADLERNLSAEEAVLAGLLRERMRMHERRHAATEARHAVTAARNALIECMARTCGLPSLTRPAIPDYYAPPAGMSARDLARHHGWGNAIRDLTPRLAAIGASLAERFAVKNLCPGGDTFTDPGGGGGIGHVGEGLDPRHRVETLCTPCQPIARDLARVLDEIAFRQGEIQRIQRRIDQTIKLKAELQAKEAQLRDLERYLQELRDIIRQGQVAGFSVAGQAQQDLTLAEGRRTQLVTQIAALRREIAAAEAERGRLAEHQAALEALKARRRLLREQLRYCEEDYCRRGFFGELDTWINVAGHDPMNPNNPAGGPPGAPPPGDPRPLATVSVTRPTGEGQAPGAFTITLSKPAPAGGVFVTYRFEGSAVAGEDFSAVFVGAPIPAGATSVEVSITPIDDTRIEGPETVQLTITPGAGYVPGVPSAAIMPFSDNDAPPQPAGTLQLGASSYSVNEGAGNLVVTVTRTGGDAGAVSVAYTTVPGSAAAGSDYQPVNGTLSWAAGDTAGKSFNVPIIDDNAVESTETFQVLLSNPTGGATLGAIASANVSIVDNDVAGPCGAAGNAWQNNAGTYNCSGTCEPTPSPQTLQVNGDRVTLTPFHAGGAAAFQGCGPSLQSQSSALVYFGQANHRATITRSSDRGFSAGIVSAGGGTCAMSCSR